MIGAALRVGSLSYGLSIVLDAYALRLVGAAREAAYFATAPFVGAIAAAVLLGDTLSLADAAVMAVMAAGVALLLREHHAHEHAHEELEHTHVHVHDEHRQHERGPEDPSGEPHSHPHRHAPLVHDHLHVGSSSPAPPLTRTADVVRAGVVARRYVLLLRAAAAIASVRLVTSGTPTRAPSRVAYRRQHSCAPADAPATSRPSTRIVGDP